MAGKLTARGVGSHAKRKGRYLDGDGLFLRVLDPGKRVYWVYRFRLNGKDRETSIGSYPATSLAEARIKHADLRSAVLRGIDPLGDRRAAKEAKTVSDAATFGEVADAYLERKEKRGELGKSLKHRRQWRSSLKSLPASFRSLPVEEIGPQHVFDALDPIWAVKPETASRLRGRIEAVLDFARKPDDVKPNPAAFSGWLKIKLGSAKKLGKIDRKTGERVERGHYAAMPYKAIPAFMARLMEIDSVASRVLQFTILTAARSGEALGATWDEISFDEAVWEVSPERMKTGEKHEAPLSDAALAILYAQRKARDVRGQNPHVFPGARPMRPISAMAMLLLARRLGSEATVHGMRTSFRTWCSEVAHAEFEVAEAALSHRVGNAVSRAYNRTSLLERRRPIMQAWSDFVTGKTNVVPIRAAS
jgi:integrase